MFFNKPFEGDCFRSAVAYRDQAWRAWLRELESLTGQPVGDLESAYDGFESGFTCEQFESLQSYVGPFDSLDAFEAMRAANGF